MIILILIIIIDINLQGNRLSHFLKNRQNKTTFIYEADWNSRCRYSSLWIIQYAIHYAIQIIIYVCVSKRYYLLLLLCYRYHEYYYNCLYYFVIYSSFGCSNCLGVLKPVRQHIPAMRTRVIKKAIIKAARIFAWKHIWIITVRATRQFVLSITLSLVY